ncbi:MAG: bifunctional serine/threonine-protein kinase/formylglycine-generating enzyme family protein, partial [Tahibacter sp.]
GIVHRDVKPENVLFDKLDRPLLADFGIAIAPQADVRMTREGATMGSTGYMSPEQARGLAIDGRSDLYSLGVVGYELLTGELPFQGPDALAVALAHVEQAVPRLPPPRRVWQPFIDRCMAKDPSERFQDAEAVLASLDQIEAELDGRGPAIGARQRVLGWLAALPAGAAVGLVAVLGVALLLGMLMRQVTSSAPPSVSAAAPSGDPATMVQAAPVPISVSVDPNASIPDAGDIDRHLMAANTLLRKHQLVEPTGGNAAEHFLEILKLAPEHSEARAGIAAVLSSLAADFGGALRHGDTEAARKLVEQGQMLIVSAQMADTSEAQAFDKTLADTFGSRLDQLRRELDTPAANQLRPVANLLVARSDALAQRWDQTSAELAGVPAVGQVFRDKGGPELLLVPAYHEKHQLDHAFALARTEVTRADYAEFARQTQRPAAKCREPLRPWSRLKSLDWRDPGFSQGNEHPVLCVSWQDAQAYAAWVSSRTGNRYRLPTEAEWLQAARSMGSGNACELGNVADASKDKSLTLTSRYKCNDGNSYTSPVGRYAASALGLRDLLGNVSEWTLDCAKETAYERMLQPNGCSERIFRGTSWRDGTDESALDRRGAVDADIGYTTVGFRVLRELSPDKLPPLAKR